VQRGADAGVGVEGAEADVHRSFGGVAGVEVAAAALAERLRRPLRWPEGADQLRAFEDLERVRGNGGAEAERGAGAALAVLAVAVARLRRLSGDPEAHAAAQAAAGEVGHAASV
jgi:hypothetical protein